MKHSLIKLTAVLLLVAILASASASTLPEPLPSNEITITLWYGSAVPEAGPPPADWKALKIIKEKLGINLVLTALPSTQADQDVQIKSAATSNTLPDLFMISRETWIKLISTGLIAPVDSLYPLMPNRTRNQYDADSRAYSTINGKSYGLASPGSICRNEGLVIRKDWLDTLGLKAPTNLDELLDVARAFTEKDPDGNGINDTYGFGAFIENNTWEKGLGRRFDPIAGAFGVEGAWNMTRAEAGLNILKPTYYDFMVYVKNMIDEGLVYPDWTSKDKKAFRAEWAQGKFGIFREQNAALHSESFYAPFDLNFPNGELVVIDPPTGLAGKNSVGVYTQAYRMYAMSSAAAKAGKGAAIARLLEWMSSNEGYFLLGWGEKGIHYVISKDGAPTVVGLRDESKGYSKPAMQIYTQLRSMVYYNGDIELASNPVKIDYAIWRA